MTDDTPTPNQELNAAIIIDDIIGVRNALSKGADVTAVYGPLGAPLHYAVTCCSAGTGIVELLLEQGTDVNTRGAHGNTPLHNAVRACRLHIVNFLLDNGADVGLVDDEGRSALHYAVMVDSETSVSLLLGNGIDTRVRDNNGKTAIDIAVDFDRTRVEDMIASFEGIKERQMREKHESEKKEKDQWRFEENLRRIDALLGSRRPRRP